MEKEAEIKINLRKIFLKNNFVLVFSVLSVLALLIFLSNVLGFSPDTGFISSLLGLFDSYLWLLLFLGLAISAILAYYKKYNLMILPLIVWLLITTAAVRTSNVPLLKNAATGDWTLGPDLDPFLFLRNAQEISRGEINVIDYLRQAPLGAPSYTANNLMPWAIFFVSKVTPLFGENSLVYAAIISPVVFFLISLLGFFLFSYTLFSFKLSKERSLVAAFIGSFLYAFIPSMLHRTVAGIPELESLGMIWFWLAFLFFVLAWKQDKSKKMIIYGALSGLFTGLMSWSWGGHRYIYMTLGLAVFLCFLFDVDKKRNTAIFASFMIPAILLEVLRVKSLTSVILSVSDSGFALGVLFLLILSLVLSNRRIRSALRLSKINLPEPIITAIVALVIIILTLLIFKTSALSNLFSEILERMLYPFGRARIALTVAENRAPYFTEVFGTFGYLFWLFFFGVIVLFYNSIKHFNLKNKIYLNLFFILFLVSFVFSRISPEHAVLTGDTFISQLLYLGGLAVFGIVVLVIYIKAHIKRDEKTLEDFRKIGFTYLLLLAFSFWAIVSMRGAVRLFFIIAPILVLIASYLPAKISEYLGSKDKSFKIISTIFLVIVILIFCGVAFRSIQVTTASVSQIVPSAYNQQWQKSMNWVSQNTPENAIFVHWWDYGYWVQTLGGRPTVTDGGHVNAWWDHTTARYLLTTPKPETALSLMKTHNVSYLLIDSSDLGKYSAYSSIGSNESGDDRLSWIPVMLSDARQTQETSQGEIRVYQGGSYLDKDIIYTVGERKVFLPAGKAAVGAVLLEYAVSEGNITFSQPKIAFIYNDQREDLPVRYLYYGNRLFDFGNGINVTLRIIPAIVQGQQGIQVDDFGAIIYLSEKTRSSLFAELYLMDDPSGKYPTIGLAHSEDDYIVESLKQQGVNVKDFVYYQGFRGPIKIWKVNYPANIITNEAFLQNIDPTDKWGSLDNSEFSR